MMVLCNTEGSALAVDARPKASRALIKSGATLEVAKGEFEANWKQWKRRSRVRRDHFMMNIAQ
jgi:hypothetical protein